MPRDISGNYTLPAGNPVVVGTIIEDTWANPTLSDIATQLNNVITRDGLLGPTAPIGFASGTVAAPGITFSVELTSGFYRVSAGVLGIAILGVAQASWSATAFSTFGNTALGNAAADTLSVSGAVIKNATGNWAIPAPSSGTALAIAQFGSAPGINVTGTTPVIRATDGGLAGAVVQLSASNTVSVLDFSYLTTPTPGSIRVGGAESIGISINRNVTIAAPSSGISFTAIGLAGTTAIAAAPTGTIPDTGYVGNFSSTKPLLSAQHINMVRAGSHIWSLGYVYNSNTFAIGVGVGVDSTFAGMFTLTTAGNVTIAAPSSGVGFTQTGFAGSDTAIFNGGTSGSFRVSDTGVPYGTTLHNNPTLPTGTTNQPAGTSGTYTPTLTNSSNIASATPTVCQWTRVGNVVTVSGHFFATTTTNGLLTVMRMTLPIASDFASAQQCGGTHSDYVSAIEVNAGSAYASAALNEALLAWNNVAGSHNRTFTFTYLVV